MRLANMVLLTLSIMLLHGPVVNGQSFGNVLLNNIPSGMGPELQTIKKATGASLVRELSDKDAQVWRVPAGQEERIIKDLSKSTGRTGIMVVKIPGDYTNLLAPLAPAADLSPRQQEILEAQRHARGTVSITIFRLNQKSLVTHALTAGFDKSDGFAQSGSIRLQLDKGQAVTAVRQKTEITNNGFLWEGAIQGQIGDVTLLSSGDQLSGTVHANGRIYSIQPLGAGLHAVIEKRIEGLPPEHPPRFIEKSKDVGPLKDIPPSSAVNPDEILVIDVIIAYTANVAKSYTNIKTSLLDLAIVETNESFRKSNIPNLRLNLVYSYQTDYVESEDWNNHLDRFAGRNDGVMDEIHDFRDKYKGDIAILIVNDVAACGEARDIFASSASAFIVLYHVCTTGYYSFAHEVGHIIGNRHDVFHDPLDTPFRYGHGFVNGKKWRTIMAYGDTCDNCERRQIWSSPDLVIDGDKAGTLDREFDAKVVRDYAKRVAGFK